MVAHPPYDQSGISGTKLNHFIEKRNVKQWTRLSFSSVYYILNQLEKKGLVKSKTPEQSNDIPSTVGAPQKLFYVTTKGKHLLKTTTIEYFNRGNLNYQETNLALAAAFVLSEEEFLEVLQIHKKSLEDRITIVQNRYSEDRNGLSEETVPIHVWGLFNYAFSALNARNSFFNELIVKLSRKIDSKQKSNESENND